MLKTIKTGNLSNNTWKVYHPEGKLMFFADDKKKNWYLEKKLARATSQDSIVLTFIPNGKGFNENDTFGLTPRKVQCVCCGVDDKSLMQRHHIVPYMYRKHMPLVYKNKNHHDVVLICYACHESYETHATILKKEINARYNVVDNTKKTTKYICVNMLGVIGDYTHVSSYITAFLLNMDRIPKQKRDIMESVISEFIGKTNISKQDLHNANQFIRENIDSLISQIKPIGEQVIDSVNDIDEFVYMWRQHFVNTMSPKFMPTGWSVCRKYLPRLD